MSGSRDDFAHTHINDIGLVPVAHAETGQMGFNVVLGVSNSTVDLLRMELKSHSLAAVEPIGLSGIHVNQACCREYSSQHVDPCRS